MKPDHKSGIVGPWAETKLDALEAYLNFYSTALKNTKFQRVYIDAFAGTINAQVRSHNLGENSFLHPMLEQEDIEARTRFILGSPARAMNIDPPFHKYLFFDMDEERARAIETHAAGTKNVRVTVGDCNPHIQALAPKLSAKNIRGVAFLDPYGAHLEWATLEALASTKNMEVIINFPLAMAINRLITKSGEVPVEWSNQLDRCFGTADWRTASYSKTEDLFGGAFVQKNNNASLALLQLYMNRLKSIFPCVSAPRLIRNTQNGPLYYLIWAGPHPLGLKGADHILSQGEVVKY